MLVIIGSGETSPTMVETHRRTLPRHGTVLLDTPYAFQENATEVTEKSVRYFARNAGRTVRPVPWTDPPDRALAAVRSAQAVFAGPGSPTYALRRWAGSDLTGALRHMLRAGGTVSFASAAAATIGRYTVPVYEIYKCGAEPRWVDGLDLLSELTGVPTSVVPHFDNAEGGTHDTRFCYLGARRLSAMLAELPRDAVTIGVDEHTALVLAGGTATVLGKGVVTVLGSLGRRVFGVGDSVTVADLVACGGTPADLPPFDHAAASPDTVASLASTAAVRFDEALAAREVGAAVDIALDLERTLREWAADTNLDDDVEHASDVLRRMIVRLGANARQGMVEQPVLLARLVDGIQAVRASARAAHDYRTADGIRTVLRQAGVEVQDGPVR